MRNARALMLWLALSGTTACGVVLGIDADGRLQEKTSDAGDGEKAAPGDEADAAPKDSGSKTTDPDPAAVDGGYLARLDELAKLRVRIADAPTMDRYSTSKSWVHWVDDVGKGHSRRPSDGALRTIPVAFTTASDDVVAHRNMPQGKASVYSATSGQNLGSFEASNPVALDDSIVFTDISQAGKTDILQWNAASPATLTSAGSVPSSAVDTVGRHRNTIYMRDVTDLSRLFVVDVAPPSVRIVTTTVTPLAVATITDGLVVAHSTGSTWRYQLIKPSGATLDLSAEIDAAESSVPVAQRTPMGAAVGLGDWLIGPALCGIVAFRPSDGRLVPVQLRASTDRFSFFGLHVLEESRVVVFTIGGSGPHGLYYLKLDGLLPP